MLYLKIDHLLLSMMNHIGVNPTFTFGEQFEVEAEIEIQKLLRRRRKLVKRRDDAIRLLVPVDVKLNLEI